MSLKSTGFNGNLKNINKLMKKLNKLEVDAVPVLQKSVDKNIKMVQGEAKLLCPVDQGTLRNSIRTDVSVNGSKIVGNVTTNMEYAPYVEFGTGKKGEESGGDKYPGLLSYKQDKWLVVIPELVTDDDKGIRWTEGQPAQPFMYPALKNNEDKVIDSVAADLEKKFREVSGK